MPHIAIKMLEGRTEEQKRRAADALKDALCKSLGCGEAYVTVTVEDFDARAWQDVFARDITAKNECLYVKPKYDPKSLL
ncbi:MAG: tautomerase family protein [Firmicutes bacterium]|nr:tautomerase family protein [Bacillota bacterium]